MTNDWLKQPVEILTGVGPKRAALLAGLGVTVIADLLTLIPRTYEDRRTFTPINSLIDGDNATIQGIIESCRVLRLRRRLSMVEAWVRDDSGRIKVTWFGRDYLVRSLTAGTAVVLSGTVGRYGGLVLKNPDYELMSGDEEDLLHMGRIVPVYRLTEGFTQRMLRRLMMGALECMPDTFEESLPTHFLETHGFPSLVESIRSVHFPPDIPSAQLARDRFAYEELLGIQLGVLGVRADRLHEEKGNIHIVDGPLLSRLRASLPFTLTAGQVQAIDDILTDMASPRPMVRLLQGDVGCGKTIVALHAMAAAADGQYQTALMAPTEILAEQHAITLRRLLEPLGLRAGSLTGGTSNGREIREAVAAGQFDIVVGTHALISESTQFHKLGLVVIDEQHRFGVMQRDALVTKGIAPDILHMTATPIPRTLAITVYGGMDISVVPELPPDRLPVRTSRVTPAGLTKLYDFIHRQAEAGFQTYYVCPLVEESDKLDLVAVTRHYEEMTNGPLQNLRAGLLHGRMSAVEKDDVMGRFKDGLLDVLFSTTVIEVGVDCPKATVMIIEDAGRFGLTQLHQLRGRVGRRGQQAYCFLLGKPKTKEGMERLRVLCDSNNGFDIAEADLNLRGPGEFNGVRQAGFSDLRVADLIRDVRLLDAARRDAQEILKEDPQLKRKEYQQLAEAARRYRVLLA